MPSRWLKAVLVIVAVSGLIGLATAFAMFGPPGFAEQIADPSFCGRCHVMEPQLAAYEAGRHSRLESCNDCHLPNDSFVRHWFWDGVVGVRDLAKYNLNIIPEHITARERSKDWIEENCRACHGDVMAGVEVTPGTRCRECHREIYHDVVLRADDEQRRPLYDTRGE